MIANIKTYVPFILRNTKKLEQKCLFFCLLLSYKHLLHFLCCFCFNIFLLTMPVHDLQWAYEKFNTITVHLQLISNSLQLFIIMVSLKNNLLANLLFKISTILPLISFFFFWQWNWLWPLYMQYVKLNIT